MKMSAHKRSIDTNHTRHLLELREAYVAAGGQEDGEGGADGKRLRYAHTYFMHALAAPPKILIS